MRRTCGFPRHDRAAWRFAAAIVITAGLAAGCGKHAAAPPESEAAEPAADTALQVTEVALRRWPRTVRAQGTLIEDEYSIIGAKVAGRVKEVMVDLGSAVKQDQPIAVLETEEFELKVRQAEAAVAQARAAIGLKPGMPEEKLDPTQAPPVLQEKALWEEARFNFERAQPLIARGVMTKEEFQQRESAKRVAEARYAAALNAVQENIALLAVRKAELALAQQNLADAVLKAPFEGMIQETQVAPGSFVSIGNPVVTLVRTNPLRFRAGIPERSSTGVKVGQPVRVFIEDQAEPVEARISRVSPALDVSSRSLIIEADIDNSAGRLRTGLFAEAEIIVDPASRTIAVPKTSIVAFGGVEKIWVVQDDKAESRRIRIGRREGNLVEVINGVKAGETIVLDGQQGREGVVRTTRVSQDQSLVERGVMMEERGTGE